jgi:hypothetical protein
MGWVPGLAAIGAGAGFIGACATHATPIGEGDHAAQSRVQSYLARVPLLAAAAGVGGTIIAAGAAAATGVHIPDTGVIHAVAAVGTGAAAAPYIASRLHRSHTPGLPRSRHTHDRPLAEWAHRGRRPAVREREQDCRGALNRRARAIGAGPLSPSSHRESVIRISCSPTWRRSCGTCSRRRCAP